MSKSAVDKEFLSDVWMRINSVISEQRVTKNEVARKCGFDRKILSSYRNLTLTYFARLCEELNVSADFFLFGLDKKKERTNVAAYQPNVCYGDMQKPQEIIKEAKRLAQSSGNGVSNRCRIAVQKDLMTLADDFGLLHRKEVQEIISTCKSYAEGQQKIMRVYTTVYLN